MFGNPETTTGGQALKFYASQRLEVRKTGALKSGDKTIGIRVKVKVAKNKLASPFGAVEIDLIFDEPGIFSRSSEILDIGQIYELVEKSGNSYSIKFDKETIKLAVGRDNARKALLSQPELMTKVEDAVREKFKQNRSAVVNKDVAATVSNGEDETATEEV